MEIIDSIADKILGDFKKEIPIVGRYSTRKEKRGYALFFNDSLRIVFLSDMGYYFIKEIDGMKNCDQVARAVASSLKFPYLVSCRLLIKCLNHFSSLEIVSLKTTKTTKVKLKNLGNFIPSAPNQIAILLTNECNLRCSHCGNENRDRKENELSKEEWFKIIDECSKIGVFIFNVSGGEPFIRKDWYEVLSYARSKKIEVAITSNSTLINEDVAEKLKELKIFNIHLSVDGVGEIHDHFRNQKGVFEKVVNAIDLLKKYKIPFGITTAVSKRNFSDLDKLVEFVRSNNISSWEIYSAIPLGCMNKLEALSQSETLEFARKISDFRKNLKDTKIFVGDNLGYFDQYNMQEDWRGCRAGISICAIDSEGNVKGCPIHPNSLIQGNLRSRTLSDIWNDKKSFGYNRNAKSKLKEHCKNCRFSKVCRGGCKASMYSQHKNFEHNDYCLKFIEESRTI
ncbi:MAG: radical SAM protein [Patescibacteria group bacterium]